MNELKPCPFCGAEVEVKDDCDVYWIECDCLSTSCCGCSRAGMSGETKQQAIAAWNTRAPVNEWVDIKQQKPSIGEKVLAYSRYGFSVIEYTGSHRLRGEHACWVTHWMVLPAPPHETTDNESP